MTVDIRSTLEQKVALHDKATKWLFAMSVDRKTTDIGKLASHLKIKKAEAIEVVHNLILNSYNTGSDWSMASSLAVFVETKFPEWLEKILSVYQKTQVISAVRSRRADRPSVTYKRTHLRLLAENVKGLRDRVFLNHLANANIVLKVLKQLELADSVVEGKLDYDDLAWVDRILSPLNSHGGMTYQTLKYDTKFTAVFNFAGHTYAQLDKLDFTSGNWRRVKYRPRRGEAVSLALTKEREERIAVMNNIIEEMAKYGLQLVTVGGSMRNEDDKFVHYSSLVFVSNNDIMYNVRLTMPWPDVMAEIIN